MDPFELKRRPIHQSLARPLLVLGVGKGVFPFELTSAGSLFLLLGFHGMTLLVTLAWIMVLHPMMVWTHAKDPDMMALLIRSLTAPDFFAAHARIGSRSPAPKPSIPRT